jgi:hypothetical protein
MLPRNRAEVSIGLVEERLQIKAIVDVNMGVRQDGSQIHFPI